MGDHKVVENSPDVRTVDTIAEDLQALGVEKGMTLVVHSSLSSLGWVVGGPVTVIQALQKVVTPNGTLVMPTQSGDYSEPSYWANPPVPKSWWAKIRESMPAFDPELTPSRGMGVIAELFRTWPEVVRSSHPALSFAAWGKYAEHIIEEHSLEYGLGEGSPLRKIYDLDGHVLLLGVDYGSNTSFHLSEYRISYRKPRLASAPIIEHGKRVWRSYPDIDFNADLFPDLGKEFERYCRVRKSQVGSAEARLFRQREAVDFAVTWLSNYYYRQRGGSGVSD